MELTRIKKRRNFNFKESILGGQYIFDSDFQQIDREYFLHETRLYIKNLRSQSVQVTSRYC